MGKKNERTGSKVATIAGKVLAGHKPTQAEAKKLAGSALTQVPNKKK